ncbi:MAG: hypothetical protein LBG19_02425, partial [Prevotellaceae bacterium]|nr:hypothetical protein [Prevotellaceae bacterium]
THQHIVNHFADSGWKKTIRDYLRYAADSFGSMPEGCGTPLFLDRCYYSIIEDVKKPHNIPEDKRKGIVNLIEAIFLSERGDVFEDIDILFKTYSRWQDTFPFALKEYLKNQKELFYNRVPFLRGGC